MQAAAAFVPPAVVPPAAPAAAASAAAAVAIPTMGILRTEERAQIRKARVSALGATSAACAKQCLRGMHVVAVVQLRPVPDSKRHLLTPVVFVLVPQPYACSAPSCPVGRTWGWAAIVVWFTC